MLLWKVSCGYDYPLVYIGYQHTSSFFSLTETNIAKIPPGAVSNIEFLKQVNKITLVYYNRDN